MTAAGPARETARSCTCTCTPSTPCWTAPPGSRTCSPSASDRACRPSPSPTTATSTAPTTSGPKATRGRASSRSSASRPTSRPSTAGTGSRSGGATPAQKDDDVSGAGAYTHMTLLAETTEGMHNLFRLSSLASLEGYFRKPRMDRELLAAVRQGDHRHHRLPRRRGADQAPARPGPPGAGGGRRLPRHLRPGQLLRRDHGPRPRRSSSGSRTGLRRIASELSLPFVVTNDSHYTQPGDAGRARGAAVRADRRPTWPTRTGSGSRAPATTSRARRRCARVQRGRGMAGGLRRHAADRRAGRRQLRQVAT